jgi:DNA gyrase/topoisomerase IV subunit A
MASAKRLAAGINENRKKKVLSKYNKKELKTFSKKTGKITLLQERRLIGVEQNAIGENSACFIVTIPELEALIKKAKKTLKTIKWRDGNGMCMTHLNEELSFILFQKKVG